MDQRVLHAAQALPELLEEVIRENLTPMHFLDRVPEQELERKNERRVATTLKLSGTSGLAHPPSQGVVFSPPFPGCERSGC